MKIEKTPGEMERLTYEAVKEELKELDDLLGITTDGIKIIRESLEEIEKQYPEAESRPPEVRATIAGIMEDALFAKEHLREINNSRLLASLHIKTDWRHQN